MTFDPATESSIDQMCETSFYRLFGNQINNKVISEIKIPLIQRDYAQGRRGETVSRIRERFLNVLCNALQPNAAPVDLDFVYGDVDQQQTFLPLDGQQRLTTLFLLHWYVAQRADVDIESQPWRRFGYDTRPGARLFCEFLVLAKPNWCEIHQNATLSKWLQDQAGYYLTWKHDPTIQSMLVMLDAIHQSCKQKSIDYKQAWERLSDQTTPAIRFNLLPLAENGLTDRLYIKMNSRGKPLTEFENFKADFEGMLKRVHPQYAEKFAQKIDNAWTDLFWEYKGSDNLIDDEFMRYFRFITEVYTWKNGNFSADKSIDELADETYGSSDIAPVEYLIKAFDVWCNPNGPQNGYVTRIFESIFTLDPISSPDDLLLLFSTPGNIGHCDLFHACCRNYGEGPKRWTYGNTLLLYAVLESQIALRFDSTYIEGHELRKRLRIVRNLIEASVDELALRQSDAKTRIQNLLADVSKIMLNGDLSNLSSLSFNRVQIHDENRKQAFLEQAPNLACDLFSLEDHPLLQGGLTVFPLDAQQFANRARTFQKVFTKTNWPSLTGALLCKGDYGRHWKRGDGKYVAFGSCKNIQPWQDLFRGRNNELQHPSTDALIELLDDLQSRSEDTQAALEAIQEEFCTNPTTVKDWRYYFVKYPEMRTAPQGSYVFGKSWSRTCQLEGKYVYSFQDPYLNAMIRLAEIPDIATHLSSKWPWFYGLDDETGQRPLTLKLTGISLECIPQGWRVSIPETLPIDVKVGANAILQQQCVGNDGILVTTSPNSAMADDDDRVILGANLLRNLIVFDTSFKQS